MKSINSVLFVLHQIKTLFIDVKLNFLEYCHIHLLFQQKASL